MLTDEETLNEIRAQIRDLTGRLKMAGPRHASILLNNIAILKHKLFLKENANVVYGLFGGKK